MSQQVWATKLAQDLKPGDLIPGQTRNPYALEISEIQDEGNSITVDCYSDLYKRFKNHYRMTKGQIVPVAVSGVKHMDEITTFVITEGA